MKRKLIKQNICNYNLFACLSCLDRSLNVAFIILSHNQNFINFYMGFYVFWTQRGRTSSRQIFFITNGETLHFGIQP